MLVVLVFLLVSAGCIVAMYSMLVLYADLVLTCISADHSVGLLTYL